MQKITMRFEEPPVLEKQPEKEQIALQRQQMAAAGEWKQLVVAMVVVVRLEMMVVMVMVMRMMVTVMVQRQHTGNRWM